MLTTNIISSLNNEQSVWQALKNSKSPIVLYGMGDGADKVISAFEKFGITVSGVMASDDFVRGQSFHGFIVKKENELAQKLGSFTVALCFASQLTEVMTHIKKVAKRHTTLVPSIPVFGNVLFDDDFISKYKNDIEKAYTLFADDLSRRVYENILLFYYTGRIDLLDEITTDKDEAFNNILKLGGNETYVDLGAYNGDTIDEFLHYAGNEYRKIIALEPNEKNFRKLQAHCADMKNVDLWQLGAYNKNTIMKFNNKAGRNSAISDFGTNTQVAEADTILCGMAASYIKADVEGADFETLDGMKNTIKNFKPRLNYSAYHRFEDIFRLPLYINSLNPEYKIYLRHHPYIPAWDTNLYCI